MKTCNNIYILTALKTKTQRNKIMEKFTRIADEMNTWAHVSNFRKAIETSKKYLLYAHVCFAYF